MLSPIEIRFRVVIPELRFKDSYTLTELLDSEPIFSLRTIVLPWLRAGNQPDRFTGSRDMHGSDIYENDVIHDHEFDKAKNANKFTRQVVELGIFGWKGLSHCYKSEVIGNIHEDLELVPIKEDLSYR